MLGHAWNSHEKQSKKLPRIFLLQEAFLCGFLGLALNRCKNFITTWGCNVQSFTAPSLAVLGWDWAKAMTPLAPSPRNLTKTSHGGLTQLFTAGEAYINTNPLREAISGQAC